MNRYFVNLNQLNTEERTHLLNLIEKYSFDVYFCDKPNCYEFIWDFSESPIVILGIPVFKKFSDII